jgi:ketosteroid isomerase-like protein
MRTRRLLLVVATAAVVAGCSGRESVDVTTEAQRLLETDRDFSAASVQHGAAEAFRMYLDENAAMFSDGRHPVHGRDSIYDIMKPGEQGYVLEWTPRAADVAQSGEMGWTWGEYTVTAKGSDGEQSMSWGKYVNVWKKNAEGEWKVVADIGNESPPPDGH